MFTFLQQLEGPILIWIQEHLRNEILTPFITGITHLGDKGMIWILLSILLICFRKTRKVGIVCATSLAVAYLINNVCLKNLLARVRPYEVVEGLTRLVEKQSDWSFPSGHTSASFAVAVVMFKELPKKYGVTALIFAFIMAFSRLYVGVHYPTDVLAGGIISTLVALVCMKFYKKRGFI